MKTAIFVFKEKGQFRKDMLLVFGNFHGIGSFRLKTNLNLNIQASQDYIAEDAAYILCPVAQDKIPAYPDHNVFGASLEILDGSMQENLSLLREDKLEAATKPSTLTIVQGGRHAA